MEKKERQEEEDKELEKQEDGKKIVKGRRGEKDT